MAISVTTPKAIATIRNPVVWGFTSDLAPADNVLYISIQVKVQTDWDNPAFVTIYEAEKPADTDGKASFYLEEILSAYLLYNTPPFGETVHSYQDDICRAYQVAYGERTSSNDGQNPVIFTDSNTFYAVLAGWEFWEWPGLTTHLIPTPVAGQAHLTRKPTAYPITKTQEDFLYCFVAADTLLDDLTFTILYTDSTTHAYTKASLGTITSGRVLAIPVGFNAEDYDQHFPAKTIKQITVEGFAQTLAVLQVMEAPHEYTKEFYYFDRTGGLQSLVTTGFSVRTHSYSRQVAARYLPAAYTPSDAELTTFKANRNPSFETGLGFRTQADLDIYEDMLASEAVWVKHKGQFLAIQILNSSESLEEDRNYLKAFIIQYTFAHRSTI